MSNIATLIPDIQQYIRENRNGWFDDKLSKQFGENVSKTFSKGLLGGSNRTGQTLRLSQMGPRCPRALWYSIHRPGEAEQLPPGAEIKYAFGHLIEALAIALAKAAGHEVTGEQDEVNVDGVLGHRDCVIDGCIVDVKSASSFSFRKFKDGSIAQDDLFGYLDQLDGYLVGSLDDPLVRTKDRAYLFAIDKQLGHMALYEHIGRAEHIRRRVNDYKGIIRLSDPPKCACNVVAFGNSGNYKLDTRASYSPFKHSCFPELRTFIYKDGPVYLTRTVRVPDVLEVDRYGNPVH